MRKYCPVHRQWVELSSDASPVVCPLAINVGTSMERACATLLVDEVPVEAMTAEEMRAKMIELQKAMA